MDVPESSTKGTTTDVDSITPAHAPLPAPAPLATSPTSSPRDRPVRRVRIHLDEDGFFKPYHPKFQKGTTVMSFIFEEGIIVAADHSSKSSMSAKNVVELNSHMLATISGGSEFLLQELQKKCYLQEQTEGRKTSVEEVLKWLAETLSAYKEELSIGIIIAMWNESEPVLYCMNGKGDLVKDDILATGSGSKGSLIVRTKFAKVCKTHSYDLRSRRKLNMSVTEAAELAKRALCIAAYSAPHTGDIVSVYHLGSGGCKKILEDDIEEWQKANLKCPRIKYEIIGKGW